MTKPTTDYLWDTNDTNTADPGAALRLDGYPFRSELPSDEHNYLHKAAGDWIAWLVSGGSYAAMHTAVGGTSPGDVSRIVDSTPPWRLDVECTGSAGAVVGLVHLDTDGVYIVWVDTANPNVVRIYSRATGATVTVTPSAFDIGSLACDGERMYCTDGVNLFLYQYDGTLLFSPAEDGVIMDVSQGCVLIWDTTPDELSYYDAVAAKTSIVIEAGAEVYCAKFAPNTTDIAVVYVCTDAIATWCIRGDGPGITTPWELNPMLPAQDGIGGLWYYRGAWYLVCHSAIDGSYLVRHVIDTSADSVAPAETLVYEWTGSAYIQLSAAELTTWGLVPGFLIAHDGTSVYAWDLAGLHVSDFTPARAPSGPLACDGLDLVMGLEAGGALVVGVARTRTGYREAATIRRYDHDEWRPLCHALAIGE